MPDKTLRSLYCEKHVHEHECSDEGTALIFLHGLGGDSELFRHQVTRFAKQYSIYLIDLPGHGKSRDSYSDGFSLLEMAKTCLDTIEHQCRANSGGPKRGMNKIVIGHSTGALVAIEMANLAQSNKTLGPFKALVLLDPPTLMPQEVKNEMASLTEAFKGHAYREALAQFAEHVFFHPSDDPANRSMIIDKMKTLPQNVLLALWNDLLIYDPRQSLVNLQLPLLLIQSGVSLNFQEWAQLNARFEFGRTVGVGHFAFHEAPEQVNSMIGRFLKNSGF